MSFHQLWLDADLTDEEREQLENETDRQDNDDADASRKE